eukprot:TRINITY_DN13496_c0_g1_i1.p1 TRINITY_DN13496_c0_g1~~TRINITY_DN13496_c0_g1_i1.p1  ORF type:complete len:141 (-),score=19.24 TRINITY_DN13496_c0_g1_i1:44-466(-)
MYVLLAVDASPCSERAFSKAVDIITQGEVEDQVLRIITVIHWTFPPENDETDQIMVELTAQAKQLIQKYHKLAEERGVKHVKSKVLIGFPRELIVEEAKAVGAEMVVVGTRGMSGIRRLMVGSVSDYVTQYATCPVLVVR